MRGGERYVGRIWEGGEIRTVEGVLGTEGTVLGEALLPLKSKGVGEEGKKDPRV